MYTYMPPWENESNRVCSISQRDLVTRCLQRGGIIRSQILEGTLSGFAKLDTLTSPIGSSLIFGRD